jgi:hypothetical protein
MGHAEKRMRKKREGDLIGGSSFIKSSFIGVGIALLLAVPLWILASVITYLNDDPDSIAGVLGLAVVYISSLAAGVFSVRINCGGALACGGLSGFLMMVLFLTVSLLFDASYDSGYGFVMSVLLRGAIVLMSIFGAYAGAQRKKSRYGRRRR